MIKQLSFILLILTLASCKNMRKEKVVTQNNPDNQVIVEDQSIDQPYQAIENESQAKSLNEGTIETIKEVEVQDRIFFSYNSSEIEDAAKSVLSTQIEWLKNSPDVKITIEGHCDERGTREYNIALGERRANAVRNYLVNNGGIDQSRIQIISYGKERPAYFGSSEDVSSKNRRAVVVVN